MPISIENLSFGYFAGTDYSIKALENINLTVDKGEFTVISGPTGCGKSTLLQLMAGLLIPESGRILLDGEDINLKGYERKKLRKKLGIVFQFPEYQLFETTVFRDVAFALKQLGLPEAVQRIKVKKALELMGFEAEKMYEKSPFELSGGQKRLVSIAGILASEPEYLLLDEPLAGLDYAARADFLSLLEGLRASGTSIIMVTHSADSAAEYAERIIVMERGQIVADAKPEAVYASAELCEKSRSVPQTVLLREILRKSGIPLPKEIYREAQLCSALISFIRGG